MSTAIARLGHNEPPSPIELGEDVIRDVNSWLKGHPVIENEDMAREAKPFLDRAKAACAEIEAERDKKVRPLNEEVATINLHYKMVHNTDKKKPGLFDKIVIELEARLGAFMIREEEKRRIAAEQARKAQEEAERIARELDAKEQEALSNASAGELDVDVAQVAKDADTAFSEFERASRFADRAERDSRVKIGGGFGKTAALREVETLHVESFNLAIKTLGPHEKIREAIISAAREYRRINGCLPDGVTATVERKL